MNPENEHNTEEAAEDSLLVLYPEKKEELETYMKTLSIGTDTEINRGFLIQSLHKAQHIFGYLHESVQFYIASRLGIHLTEIYGVISFYSFFTDKPVGKYRINVCLGTACFVKGADKILEEFKRYLNIGEEETTPDSKFSLGGLRCVGTCSMAPVVMVNERIYGHVTNSRVPDILHDCK